MRNFQCCLNLWTFFVISTGPLFLVFDPDPKMAGHHWPIGADSEFAQLELFLPAFQHTRVNETKVWDAAVFLTVIIHGLLDLDAQRSARVVVEP